MAKQRIAVAPTADQDQGAEQEIVQEPKRGDPFATLRVEDCKPYTGKSCLPKGKVVVDSSPIVNERGETVSKTGKPVVYCGEPRLYLEQTPAGWLNLIGAYHKGNSTGQRLLRTLKTKRPAPGAPKPITERWDKDTAIHKKLLARGIPTYMTGQVP